MSRISQLVRKNILAMKSYSSARDEYSDVGEVVLLDANENPFANGLNRYPDPYQHRLKNDIAKLKKVTKASIFLGNGSDEAIDLILRIFCEPGADNIIITDPTYGMYEVAAAIQDVPVRKVPLTEGFRLDKEAILKAADARSKVLFLCSPNNPSGNLFDDKAMRYLIENFEGIVVVDEAYIDFTERPSLLEQLTNYDNLIVLQTFSKAWGLAGLRLGMAFSGEEIIGLFNKVKAPYNLSTTTQKVALDFLSKANEKQENVEQLLKERERLARELRAVAGVEKIFPSDANFLLVQFTDHQKVYELLTGKGIIVRDRSKALHCRRCLRLTVGTKDDNHRLLEALKGI